jgi:hypothetical protein
MRDGCRGYIESLIKKSLRLRFTFFAKGVPEERSEDGRALWAENRGEARGNWADEGREKVRKGGGACRYEQSMNVL